jgi:hypothetical protein
VGVISIIQGKEFKQLFRERKALSRSSCFKIDQRLAEKRAMNARRRLTEKLAFANSMIGGRRPRERSTGGTAIRGNRSLPLVGLADRCPLGKRNRDGLLVSAEFWRQTAYEVDDNGSAAIGEFHVHPIRTGFWCHTKRLRRIRFENSKEHKRKGALASAHGANPRANCSVGKTSFQL